MRGALVPDGDGDSRLQSPASWSTQFAAVVDGRGDGSGAGLVKEENSGAGKPVVIWRRHRNRPERSGTGRSHASSGAAMAAQAWPR